MFMLDWKLNIIRYFYIWINNLISVDFSQIIQDRPIPTKAVHVPDFSGIGNNTSIFVLNLYGDSPTRADNK